MAGSGTYTAETLAFCAGLPLRTVRYYVQEGLVDPPLGRGRGAHFTDHHLAQLQQARTLQNSGFSLEAIRERRGDLSLGLQVMQQVKETRRQWRRAGAVTAAEDGELDPGDCLRIPMAEGVELLVANDQPLPSPRELVEIALHIRKAFGPRS
ncbi:MAG TPA: helix-turn-helix domain-containing protein [Phenylobacterium sp.]|uniref:helix-turn-helix domain-containing protein n=1 Tax=Phenylobacterium sp. TaxID=1871053 RepID=UPI002C9F2553|nr:helix-turn-helix domain-containing protein [Phenylobacterium sp.]HSV03201.1 helix-turn-helix domain-containing protein [Phenylobacterium sp.]